MTALLLAYSDYGPRLKVTVLESPQVGIIGVGEGFTLWPCAAFRRAGHRGALNDRFEGTRDYIVTHYKANTRTDTDDWRANAANINLSRPLQQLLHTWLARRPIAGGLQQGSYGRGYPIMSWYCLLAGMGLFPDAQETQSAPPGKLRHDLAAIDNLLERSAANFPEHRALLADIPPRPAESALQLYLW